MSDFLLPDEELRMQRGATESDVSTTPFLLPGEQTASEQAAVTVRRVANVNPDKAARTKALSILNDLPIPVVERNSEQVETETKVRELQKLMVDSPILARQMTDPAFASLAHDDGENLSTVEKVARKISKGSLSILSAIPAFNEGAWGVAQAAAETGSKYLTGPLANARVLPQDIFGVMGEKFAAYRRQQGDMARGFTEEPGAGPTETAVYSGLQSLGLNLMTAPLAIETASAKLPLLLMGGQTGGQSFGQARDKGLALEQSLAHGGQQGIAEYVTEMIPAGAFVKSLDRGYVKATLEFLKRDILGEQAATIWQDFNEWMNLNPEKSINNFLAERNSAGYQTLIATLVGGGGALTVAKAADAIGGIGKKAETAQQNAEAMANLSEIAKASKVLTRDPQSFQDFVTAASEDGPVQDVFIDARTFAQSLNNAGVNVQEFAQGSPTIAAQIEQALEAGGDLVVPLGEYAAKIAATDAGAALLPHLRTESDGMSRAEAQAFMDTRGEQLKAEVEKVMSEKQADTAFQESAAKVEGYFNEQLSGANRFTGDVNKVKAKLVSSFYTVQASRLGITPEEMLQRYPLQIRAESVSGANVMDQAVYNEDYGFLPDSAAQHQNLDGPQLEALRGAAAGLEKSESGVTLRVTAEGQAIATGPKGAKVPQSFVKFAEENGLLFMAQRRLPAPTDGGADLGSHTYSKPMPLNYRVGGALYFNEMGDAWLDRTGKTLFQGGANGQPNRDQPATGTATGQELHGTIAGGNPRDGWVDATRIRGTNNRPITLHRGAALALAPEHFDAGALGVATNRPSAGLGVWFTVDRAEAASYGEAEEFYLDLRNPLIVKADELPGFESIEAATAWREEQRAAGYDGLIVTARHLGGRVHTVAFDAEQVIYPPPPASVDVTEFFQPKASDTGDRGKISFAEDITQTPSVISLLKNADLSTFLHELGHFQLEVLTSLATQPNAPQEVHDDANAVLKWFGVRDLPTWTNLSLEEKRGYHEQFARGFEAYLFEGKSPNPEMNSVFARFRDWLVNIYKSITALNVELTPEVRGVFDRLIATDEQIQAAEAARNYAPLFKTAEEAGMTAQEFADYQTLGGEATADATSQFQTRTLRDMQWLRNARSRVLKGLQKEAEGKRRAVRAEVRTEVMSQPVYKAWAFLTSRISTDDKIEAPKGAKSDPNTLDETQDSLFKAIAKLGGINKAQIVAEWGIDPKDSVASGVFGKRVLRGEGLTLDGMGEALAQYGYLTLDENGKFDLHEFEEKFGNELRGSPEYSNFFNIEQETIPGQEIANLSALNAGRFDSASLIDMATPEAIQRVKDLRMVAKEGGLHPDLVASEFGFNSGDELVRAIAAAPMPSEAIENLTDQRMLEKYGDINSPEALQRATDEAVHNKLRAKMIATELNALVKAMNPRIDTGKTDAKGRRITEGFLPQAAKQFAEQIISRKRVRDVKPAQFIASEVRAAKAAEKAASLQEKINEKKNQLINHYAARAAQDALSEVEQATKYMSRITKPAALKNMRGEPRAQMLAILDRFDIRKSVALKELDRQQSLADWSASEAERLAAPPPILSEAVANETTRTHYKNLTVEEFRGLVDSIKQLEHLARREHKAYIAIRNMTLQEEVANAVAEIREAYPELFDEEGKAKLETPLTHRYAPSFAKNLSKALRHMNAEFVPMEELVDQLTAGKFGLLHDSLFGRLSDASDRKSIMAGEIRDRLKPAYSAYTLKEKHDFPRKVVANGMTRENIIMIALYYGNVEGRQRLASQGFGDQQVLPLLSHLTSKDLDLAEAIWSLNDDYIWPMYAALNERTRGKAPAKVQALPVTIGAREVRGGYVKLVYDSAFDETTRHRDSMDDAMAMIGGRASTSAKTEQGSSNERIAELSRMPLLELRAMSQAVNEHMHDIAYREAVADTVRVLRMPAMRDAIKVVSGNEVYTELLAKVNEIAARPANPASYVLKALDLARRNTIVVLMSGVKTALVNYSGLIPAMNRVNGFALAKNMAKVHSRRMREMVRFAMENSIYMRERNQQFTSDLQHEMASLTVKNQLLPTMSTFLILMRTVDQITSTTVWTTAYEEGVRDFADHDRAVEYANNVTRSTQASGRDVDTPKIMTRFGPWSKPFLMFYSFFNRQLALLVRQGVIAERAWSAGDKARAVGIFAAAYISVVVIPALINDMATGKCDDAFGDGEGWGKCIGKAVSMNMAGYVPVLRDVAPYAWAKLDDSEPDWGLRTTALSAYFEGVIKGAASTVNVIEGDYSEKDTKAIFMGLAFSFGLPGKLMWDVTAGTEAVVDGDAPPQSILFGPPKKH